MIPLLRAEPNRPVMHRQCLCACIRMPLLSEHAQRPKDISRTRMLTLG